MDATIPVSRPRRAALAAAALALGLLLPGRAPALDRDLYAELLARHTAEVPDTAGTRVDYAGLRGSPDWRRLVESLEAAGPEGLNRAEQLAFWINVYNVLAIDMVVRHDPEESIRDIGSLLFPVWKREAGTVGRRSVTLHEVEHEILRPLGEPRIHAAIVCASVSCPSLRREPFEAARLEAQLDDSMRRFLADPRKGARLDRADETLHLSSIFKWFAEDFEPEGGVRAFARRYLPEDDARWLARREEEVDLDYLDYDWSLNDLTSRRPGST